MPKPQIMPNASLCPVSLALAPATSSTKIARCATPLAYSPVYTAPTPNGKNPAKIPATVGFGPPLPVGPPLALGAGIAAGAPPETNPEVPNPDAPAEVPAGTPSIFAPRQSSQ